MPRRSKKFKYDARAAVPWKQSQTWFVLEMLAGQIWDEFEAYLVQPGQDGGAKELRQVRCPTLRGCLC